MLSHIYSIITEINPTSPPISHRGPHPADSGGLGGSGAELIESQRWRRTSKHIVLKESPTAEALGSQRLVVLTQKLHRIVVLSQTLITIPLAPKPGSHACGINGRLHHPELMELTTQQRSLLGVFFGSTIRCLDVSIIKEAAVTYCINSFYKEHCSSSYVNGIKTCNAFKAQSWIRKKH